MQNILSQTQVEDIARKYYPAIAEAITNAFADYLQYRSIRSVSGVVDLKPRTCASLIHDSLRARLKEALGDDQTVQMGEFNELFGLLIQGQVFIRFKKMNRDLTTSNIQTKQTEDYLNQADIDGIPGRPTLLIAGYIPDSSWTSIKNIYLLCRSGETIIWRKDLTSEVSQSSIFTIEEPKQDENAKSRVTPKKRDQGLDEKTGTDN